MREIQVQGSRFKVQGGRVRYFPGTAKRLKGFTLIEVLIAMTLLSIMVVLLFASLRICAESWEQGESKIAEVNETAVVYNFFQRHLSPAIPLWNDFAKKTIDKTFSFQGKKQSLEFVSVFPASSGRAGMQLFSITQQEQDKERVIKVTLTPFFPVSKGDGWRPEEVVLLRHVSDFSLAYFGAVDGASESSWQDEWVEKDIQPQLVKIRINTTNDVFWPEMIIELKVPAVAVNNADASLNTLNNTDSTGSGN
jgi:general secretion pathway protein J